jgi:hypothetical protein
MASTRSLSTRLGLHFAACAAGAATVAHPVCAEVVRWDCNLVIPANFDGLYINVATQGTGTSATSTSGWDINPYGATTLNFFASATAPNPTTTYLRTQTSGGPSRIQEGTAIGPAGPFANSTAAVISATGVGANGWTINSVNYFGFRFYNDVTASINYGFGAMQVGATAAQRTLLFVSYENNGTAIVIPPSGPYDPCATSNPAASIGANTVTYRDDDTVANITACGGTIFRANYYRFTAGDAGSYTFETCPTSGAASMALLSACDSSASVLACGTSACGGTGSTVTTTLAAGASVWLAVGKSTADANLGSTVPITVTAPPIAACVNAASAPFGISPFSNAGQTVDQTALSAATGGTTAIIHKAAWYKFVPGVNGLYTFSLCGSVNDTKMALGTACPAAGQTFQSLAYNDDTCPCSSGCGTTTQSNYSSKMGAGQTTGIILNTELTAGTTYYIVVGGFGATTAAVSGNLEITGPPQPNCPADLNDDGFVNGDDLGILLSQWGECTTSCSADFNGDGFVNGDDLGVLLAAWGACP